MPGGLRMARLGSIDRACRQTAALLPASRLCFQTPWAEPPASLKTSFRQLSPRCWLAPPCLQCRIPKAGVPARPHVFCGRHVQPLGRGLACRVLVHGAQAGTLRVGAVVAALRRFQCAPARPTAALPGRTATEHRAPVQHAASEPPRAGWAVHGSGRGRTGKLLRRQGRLASLAFPRLLIGGA